MQVHSFQVIGAKPSLSELAVSLLHKMVVELSTEDHFAYHRFREGEDGLMLRHFLFREGFRSFKW